MPTANSRPSLPGECDTIMSRRQSRAVEDLPRAEARGPPGHLGRGLEAAGCTDAEITPTHPVADGPYSAIVRATVPVESDGLRSTQG